INRDCFGNRWLPQTTRADCVPDVQATTFRRRRHQPRRPPLAKIRPGRPAPAIGPGTGAAGVDTSRISSAPTAGASPPTFTKTPLRPKVRPPAIGRNAELLAGSTVTPVISTMPKNTNPKPVKTSEHGSVLVEQNGTAAWLVMVICVPPTLIVD